MPYRAHKQETSSERELRRLANQIATQLPENPEEARLVVRYMRELIDWTEGHLPPVLPPIKLLRSSADA
jgi:hypothetical protein